MSDLILRALLNEEPNPFEIAGQQMIQQQRPTISGGGFLQNFAMQALPGIAGGLMQGYGRQQREQEQNQLMSSLPEFLGADAETRQQMMQNNPRFSRLASALLTKQAMEEKTRQAALEQFKEQEEERRKTIGERERLRHQRPRGGANSQPFSPEVQSAFYKLYAREFGFEEEPVGRTPEQRAAVRGLSRRERVALREAQREENKLNQQRQTQFTPRDVEVLTAHPDILARFERFFDRASINRNQQKSLAFRQDQADITDQRQKEQVKIPGAVSLPSAPRLTTEQADDIRKKHDNLLQVKKILDGAMESNNPLALFGDQAVLESLYGSELAQRLISAFEGSGRLDVKLKDKIYKQVPPALTDTIWRTLLDSVFNRNRAAYVSTLRNFQNNRMATLARSYGIIFPELINEGAYNEKELRLIMKRNGFKTFDELADFIDSQQRQIGQ